MYVERLARLLLAVVIGAVGALAQPAARNSAIAGQWSGSMDGLPAVRLVVQENDRKLTGAVLYFFVRRDPGVAPVASARFPEPMLNPSFDGRILTFQVNHRYAHPPSTLNDPPVSLRLEITGSGEAKLSNPEGPSLVMIREKYQ